MQSIIASLSKFPKLTALIAGLISALGFLPWGFWPITLICFGVLIWLTAIAASKPQAFFIGWFFAVGHFCWGLQWIAVSFTYQGAMPEWIGYLSVFLLSLYLAIYPAFAALGAYWVMKLNSKGKAPSVYGYVIAFAGFWILTEWLRSWIFSGFAWNPLAVSMLDSGLTFSASAIGTYGVSGLVIVASAISIGLLAAVLKLNWRIAIERALNFILLAFAVWLVGWMANGNELPASQTISQVTIAQPNITQEERNDSLLANANVAKIVSQSERKDGQATPRLLLWPESAITWYLESGYPYRFYQFQPGESAAYSRQSIAELLGPDDILITGNDRLIIDKDGQLIGAHNSVGAMNAQGQMLNWYNKAHLVPYGEYLPLRWILEPLGASQLVPGSIDFFAGPGARSINLGTGLPNVGIQICYEIIFSGQVVDTSNRPDFIFNPSNDAWFGDIGPPQHLAQARLRAIEEGLPVLRSTPTGISAIIGRDGAIIEQIPLSTAGRIDAKIPHASSPTWFARLGNMIPVGLAFILIALALIPVARVRRHG